MVQGYYPLTFICYNSYMMDPELQHYLSGINQHLVDIKNKRTPGIFRSFFHGMFTALGYIFGFALIILGLTWFLNRIGVLPAFQKQLRDFQTFVNTAQKTLSGEQSGQGTGQTELNVGSTFVLPNGQKVKIVPAN